MTNLKRTQYTVILIIILLFIMSVLISIFAGIAPQIALIDSALDSLQVSYPFVQFSLASNPLILVSKLLDAVIFPLLTVLLAAWFFDFINNLNLRERMVLSKVNKLKGHVIVVPYNGFAKSVIQELENAGLEAVTIAENKKELLQLYKEDQLAIDGDIRSVETFDSAGIERAKCVVACGKDDVQNALISITAKAANSDIKIICRANKEENLERLEKAGVQTVIMAESTAGQDVGDELARRLLSKSELKGK